ncbi:winged helix-turn-helix domain-containing protein [Streptomyces sp. SCA3-4]|uniref:winged helix-turn-helix domain-containing protein n=1 Tax=Streptomyces sichuanensis TaxID=2871810 RepID=UPI001CE37AD9|nr:winged helix-turn-helix domain-containing protein [Streptomyces sichuanensis]MCA6096021.1 winged helix-turn-helix domain-containing protein [Streptomyces sichuanensis]
MGYRIHFTTEDLARTRVAETPLPLSELGTAVRTLQDRSRPVLFDAWRSRVAGRLPAGARMALSLIPPVGWSPTFLNLPRAGTPEELLEEVRGTPRAVIESELAVIAARQPLPRWAHRLPDDAALLGQLLDGLGRLHDLLLRPYWQQITGFTAADRAVRARQLLGGGVESLLVQANPRWIRWEPPVLEVRMANEAEADLHLSGQGILLVPSVFSTRSFVDEDALPQPVVTYPVGRERPLQRLSLLAPGAAGAGPSAALTALLGRTRAAVLHAVAEHPDCSTKELAAAVGVAPASASEHATVLREAGLIRTVRHRNTVLHGVTGLGVELLNSPRAGSSR